MNILVTGGAGVIGSSLVSNLSEDSSNDIIVLDNLSSGRVENVVDRSNVKFIVGGVEVEEDLKKVFKSSIDVVYHLAANFANQNSVDFPQRDLLVNGMGTLRLLEHSLENNVKKVIYSSSSCVYGNREGALSEVCNEYSLDTPYAITKLLGERYLSYFHEHHKLDVVTLRYFNVFGPPEYPGQYRNAIANFFHRAMNDEDMIITGTGEETRDFNYVENTVRGTILAGTTDAAIGQIFNLASGKDTKIIEIVDSILDITGSSSKVIYQERRNWDSVSKRLASVDHAKDVLGFEPIVGVREGLEKYYQWLQGEDMRKCKW